MCIPRFQASMMSAENDPLGPLPPGWGEFTRTHFLSHMYSYIGALGKVSVFGDKGECEHC